MTKKFICTYEENFGEGLTLLEAYDACKDCGYDTPDFESCNFYEVEQIEVEYKITKKEVVSKISKKSLCED